MSTIRHKTWIQKRPSEHKLLLESLEDRRLMAGDLAFSAPTAFNAGVAPWDVAAGDLNGDRILDLAVANFGAAPPSGDVSVLIGRGDGTFDREVRYQADNKPNSIAIADVNQDGHSDLLVTNVDSGNVSVLLNNGDGTFPANPPAYRVGRFPTSLKVADVNRDGQRDLILSTSNSGVQWLQGNGDGTFAAVATIGAGIARSALDVGDFNRDGVVDVAISNTSGNHVAILLGKEDGSFEDGGTFSTGSRGRSPVGVAIGDLNRDGHLDLVTPNDDGRNVSVLLGHGDGTFAEGVVYGAGSNPGSVALADLDRDGDLDVAALNNPTSINPMISVLLNDGAGQFGEPVVFLTARKDWSVAIIAADLDQDGAPDLIATNAGCCSRGPVSILMNVNEPNTPLPGDSNGDGVFDSSDLVKVFQAGKYEDGIPGNATYEEGDWNNDGDFDSGDLVLAFQAGHYKATARPLESRIAAAVDRLFARDDDAKKGRAFVS